ncbi:MAG: SRPBCC family protein [Parvularculaceae bacterium]|nr:SRPBCC family protein [Parvularculaceae bacterium]
MAPPVAVASEIIINAPANAVMAAAAGFDIPDIIRAHGPLPGVARVDGHEGPWSAAGQQRRLTLTDGSTATETLVDIHPRGFEYKIEFGAPFSAVARSGGGRFCVADEGAQSLLNWRYHFEPASILTAPVVVVVAKLVWPGYMRAALARLKDSIEKTSIETT